MEEEYENPQEMITALSGEDENLRAELKAEYELYGSLVGFEVKQQ